MKITPLAARLDTQQMLNSNPISAAPQSSRPQQITSTTETPKLTFIHCFRFWR